MFSSFCVFSALWSLSLWHVEIYVLYVLVFFFFKQKTAYEMRISDWSSDVCSSDLCDSLAPSLAAAGRARLSGSRGPTGLPTIANPSREHNRAPRKSGCGLGGPFREFLARSASAPRLCRASQYRRSEYRPVS